MKSLQDLSEESYKRQLASAEDEIDGLQIQLSILQKIKNGYREQAQQAIDLAEQLQLKVDRLELAMAERFS